MKNKLVAILLIVVCSMPLYAGDGAYETTDSFTIKAYKNSPGGEGNPTTILSVYDALTGTLNEVGQDEGKSKEIDVYNYLGKFLTNDFSKIKSTRDQVLFSYLVSGSGFGSYTLTIELKDFEGPYKITYDDLNNPLWGAIGTNKQFVEARYQLNNVDVIFPSNHSKNSGQHSIALGTDANTVNAQKKNLVHNPTYSITWNVNRNGGPATLSNSWISEGVILMAVSQSSYESVTTGGYKSTVTVTLSKN